MAKKKTSNKTKYTLLGIGLVAVGAGYFIAKHFKSSVAGIGAVDNILTLKDRADFERFKKSVSGWIYTAIGPLPYRLDDLTNKGGNYTIYLPYKDRHAYSKSELRRLMRAEVDLDQLTVIYVKH